MRLLQLCSREVLLLCSGPDNCYSSVPLGKSLASESIAVLLCFAPIEIVTAGFHSGKYVTLHNKRHLSDLFGRKNPGGWLPQVRNSRKLNMVKISYEVGRDFGDVLGLLFFFLWSDSGTSSGTGAISISGPRVKSGLQCFSLAQVSDLVRGSTFFLGPFKPYSSYSTFYILKT